ELVLLEVYRRLARRHDVRVLTPWLAESLRRDHGSSEYDGLVNFAVERYEDRVTLMRVRGHRWTAGALPPFSLSAVAAVRRAIAAARPDVLNVHYAMPTGLAAVVAERAFGVPTVFALQRLAPEKRVDALLHALRHCLDGGTAVTLVIGGTGPEAPGLRALAAELGIDKYVRFVGYIPRAALAGYFEACDVFAFHSTYETFGLVVAQAMSYGRPVVTVRSTALPEVVGDAGVLVPSGDARAFGEAIAALAHDPDRRRALGEA